MNVAQMVLFSKVRRPNASYPLYSYVPTISEFRLYGPLPEHVSSIRRLIGPMSANIPCQVDTYSHLPLHDQFAPIEQKHHAQLRTHTQLHRRR